MSNDHPPPPLTFQIKESTPAISELNIKDVPLGTIQRFWVHIVTDGMGVPVYVPVIVARGKEEGKVLGLTAVIHGNEINGIPVVQKLFNEIDVNTLRGTVVGVPVANVPSFLRRQRRFVDDVDLNHIMPGDPNGNVSDVYAWRIVHRIVKEFDYLIDLHTASVGRVNSYYIRADKENQISWKMALLQNAQILVHTPAYEQTLRGTASRMGVPAITLEVGNPNVFQKGIIRDGLTGIHNLMVDLDMVDGEIEEPEEKIIQCGTSYWLYADKGGILEVKPKLAEMINKGQEIAILRNIFGDVIKKFYSPEDGVVIGKEVNPISQTGGRLLHLGILEP